MSNNIYHSIRKHKVLLAPLQYTLMAQSNLYYMTFSRTYEALKIFELVRSLLTNLWSSEDIIYYVV